MGWMLSSVVAAVAFACMLLCFQRLQKTYAEDVYLFYVWLGSALFFGALVLRAAAKVPVEIGIVLLAAGVASWLGNYSYSVAMRIQPNLGYIEAISSIRLVIVYVFSLIFLGANLDLPRLLAVVVMVAGVLLVTTARNECGNKPGDRSWLFCSMTAGIAFAVLIVASRSVNERGVPPDVALFFVLAAATAIQGASAVVKKIRLKLSRDVGILLVAVVCAVAGNAALFRAYATAPNLAYPTAINSGRMVLLFLFSVVVQRRRFEAKAALGTALAFLSALLLS